ncbi:hypothetical protein Dimus_037694 [Dionaea muscipula]
MKSDGTGHIWRRGAWIGVGKPLSITISLDFVTLWLILCGLIRVLVCGVRVSCVYCVPQLATVWMMSDCLWVVDGRGMLSPVIWDVSDAADVPLIAKAYQEQFGDDFTLILRTRAEEIVSDEEWS